MDNNELKHYGVLGMRWGVRKRRRGYGDSEDSVKARAALKKNINEMSNKELQDANNRMRLENDYKDLVRKGTVGKKIVNGLIIAGATISALEKAQKAAQSVNSNRKWAQTRVKWATQKWQNRKLPSWAFIPPTK